MELTSSKDDADPVPANLLKICNKTINPNGRKLLWVF